MKRIAGVLVGGVGVGVAVYLGTVVFFVGGVERIADGASAHPVDGGEIGWGIIQILLTETVAIVGIIVSVILGMVIATGDSFWHRRRRRNSRASRFPRY